MSDINKFICTGRLGADADVKRFENSDNVVAHLRVATTEKFRTRDGQTKDETQWHRVDYWVRAGSKVVDYLKKGTLISLEGKLTYQDYTDQQGITKTTATIKADRVNILQLPKQEESQRQGQYQPNGMPAGYQPQGYQQRAPQPQPQYQPQPQQPVYAQQMQQQAPVAPPQAPADEMDDLPF